METDRICISSSDDNAGRLNVGVGLGLGHAPTRFYANFCPKDISGDL